MSGILKAIFGSANDRFIKKLRPIIKKINKLEDEISKLSDEELKAQTDKFRTQLEEGTTLDKILPEVFATVREAAKRAIGLRAFDVQLVGGIVLHKGMISEMKTGEGKTLVAVLPAYLNAISGKGVHIVTVNDYLAKYHSEWMGEIYNLLGLTVSCIFHDLSDDQRREAYKADITYGTNNEFGFDYLRDNMKFDIDDMVQRPFNYAIVDEVDSILIDEARTPLIISGPTEDNSDLYVKVNKLIPKLNEKDYEIDEKSKSVTFSEDGVHNIEEICIKEGYIKEGESIYDIENSSLLHHVTQALKAHKLFTADIDYMVKDDAVIIIDEFTGRMMEGRRYSEGLHQALEAKENVTIQNENQTLASITFQNYFRLYPKLAGMTGTAMTEADEFADIYKLESVEIPTNVSVLRDDRHDEVYRNQDEKYNAIVNEIADCYKRKQPILVGTVSVEKSEYLAKLLKKKNVPYSILNAKYHEQEAGIVAQAGRLGAVTIATNMAGRGTDIMLGGNPKMGEITELQAEQEKKEVIEVGGLYVLGTERHESRRIDNQLRGRSGRQGDSGVSKFFLAIDDDLMRIFGAEKLDGILKRLGLKEGESIKHPWVNKALEKAQKKVEARNYDIRKNLLKFDDVMNDQRKVIYEQRIDIMDTEDLSETVQEMREDVLTDLVKKCIPERSYPDDWDTEHLEKELFRLVGVHLPAKDWAKEEGVADSEILERVLGKSDQTMKEKEARYGEEMMRVAEKRLLLQTLDQLWKDHLLTLDHLRQGISLRAYAQRDPLNEYKMEAFNFFEAMLHNLKDAVTSMLSHLVISVETPDGIGEYRPKQVMHEGRQDPASVGGQGQQVQHKQETVKYAKGDEIDPANPNTWGKVQRNALCPCGSGKKYKQCHGKV